MPAQINKDPDKVKAGKASGKSRKRKREGEDKAELKQEDLQKISRFTFIASDATALELEYEGPTDEKATALWESLQLDTDAIRSTILNEAFGSPFSAEEVAHLDLRAASQILPSLVSQELDLRMRAPKAPISYPGSTEKVLRTIAKAAEQEAEYLHRLPKAPAEEAKTHFELMSGLLKAKKPMSQAEANELKEGWFHYQTSLAECFRRELSLMALQLQNYNKELSHREIKLGAVGAFITKSLQEAAAAKEEDPPKLYRLSPHMITAVRPDLHRCQCWKCIGEQPDKLKMIIQSVDQVPGAIQAQISTNAIAEMQTSDQVPQAVRAQISAEAIASIQSVDQVPQAIRMQISAEAMADIQSLDQVPDTLLTQIRARAVEEERIRVTQEVNQLSLRILPKLEKEAVENYRVEQMTRTYNSLELANDRREMCETLEQAASAIEWEKYALGAEWDAEWEELTNPQRIEERRAAGKRDFMVATEARSQGLWSNLPENDEHRAAIEELRQQEVSLWEEHGREAKLGFLLRTTEENKSYKLGQKQNRYQEALLLIESENLDNVRLLLLDESERRLKLDPPQRIEIPREFIEVTDSQMAEFEEV